MIDDVNDLLYVNVDDEDDYLIEDDWEEGFSFACPVCSLEHYASDH